MAGLMDTPVMERFLSGRDCKAEGYHAHIYYREGQALFPEMYYNKKPTMSYDTCKGYHLLARYACKGRPLTGTERADLTGSIMDKLKELEAEGLYAA